MTRTPTLDKKLTATALKALAGPVIFARGESYQGGGRVSDLAYLDGMLSAAVCGSSFEDYQVSLWLERGSVDYSCSCPMGEGGECCKHVVATGLAWLAGEGIESHADDSDDFDDEEEDGEEEDDDDGMAAGQRAPRNVVMTMPRSRTNARSKQPARLKDASVELRAFLLQQDKEALADWLLAQARSNASLREALQTWALVDNPENELKAFRQAFDKALRVKDFISYADVREMVGKVRQLMLRIQHAGKNLSAANVAELAEHALRKALRAYGRMDDSSGFFGGFLHELCAWYQAALRRAGAGSPLKGKVLFDFRQQDEWDYFRLQDFCPLLSREEYQRFRELAERQWQKVPVLTPANSKGVPDFAVAHFQITRLMEELAEYEGDFDQLIAIMQRQLTSPWRYLQVAEKLQQAKRRDEALAFAEKGIEVFPGHWDSRLVDFLLRGYRQRKQHDKARDLAWRYFQAAASLEAFTVLKQVAGKGKDWPQWRQRALDWLDSSQGEKKKAVARGNQHQLFEILLAEDDLDAALQHARSKGANASQWLRLAKACEQHDPRSAAEIYRNQVNAVVNGMNKQAYAQAADIVRTVQRLMKASKEQKQFTEWFAGFSALHKAKRNLMAALQQRGL